MFFRSRRYRDGWVALFRRSRTENANPPRLLDKSEFAIAIEKERCRSDRRELCFSIVRFEFSDPTILQNRKSALLTQLVQAFRNRLRITDEIGEFESSLAVLLPETYPSQAARVTNDLTDLATDLGIDSNTDIVAYPEFEAKDEPPRNGTRKIIREDKVPQGEADGTVDPNTNGKTAQNGQAFSEYEISGSIATLEKAEPVPKDKKQASTTNCKVVRLATTIPTPKWKRAIDIAGASFGLLILSPVFAASVVAIRCTSRGPAFFLQWREGKDGRLFKIYKFRTMRLGADDEKEKFRSQSEQDGPAFKIKNDPRITTVGKYLRKSCVDELPQLINVLKGQMSLVGPRPLPVDESLNCSQWHRRRLDVLPGMTCIWQVDGGRDIPFDEWMRMDLDYVKKRSFFTDVKLIAKTALVTLLHRGSV